MKKDNSEIREYEEMRVEDILGISGGKTMSADEIAGEPTDEPADVPLNEPKDEDEPQVRCPAHGSADTAQVRCPYCGSVNTAEYIYGLPAFDEKMQRKIDEGKWVLGGCKRYGWEINGKYVDTMPERKCNDCKKDICAAPVLVTPKKETVEDYRDIVTSIMFYVGSFGEGYTRITIRKNDEGASVKIVNTVEYEDHPVERQISHAKWQEIVNALYCQMYIHEWKKSFVDPDVVEGTEWSLEIRLTGRRERTYYGSNAYPPYWDRLLEVFGEFAEIA